MPLLARVFQSGNSQAVRLPKEFRFSVDRVEVTREGDALVLRPYRDQRTAWASLKHALERGVSEDFTSEGRAQPKGQDRPEIDAALE